MHQFYIISCGLSINLDVDKHFSICNNVTCCLKGINNNFSLFISVAVCDGDWTGAVDWCTLYTAQLSMFSFCQLVPGPAGH